MTKIIAITGGTGRQGGGVANVMLETPGWEVRIVTRNPESDNAKALTSKGAKVVQANFDNEASLTKAFEGSHAIFAVTNFWEHLFTGKNQVQSGEAEEEQGMKLAHAAANTSTLEHYIWSSLPSAEKMTNGKFSVAHLDYKAHVDDRIKAELPELARKTTYLYFGYYPTNMVFFGFTKPFEVPGTYGKHVQLLPTSPKALIPVAGDMTLNPGIWVRQILANPSVSLTKVADVAPEFLSFEQMITLWSEVSGKQGVFVECSLEDFTRVWGSAGDEMGAQLKCGEQLTDWHAGTDFVGMEELGIKKEEVKGFKETLEGLKTLL